VYVFITKLCRQQAEVVENHEKWKCCLHKTIRSVTQKLWEA